MTASSNRGGQDWTPIGGPHCAPFDIFGALPAARMEGATLLVVADGPDASLPGGEPIRAPCAVGRACLPRRLQSGQDDAGRELRGFAACMSAPNDASPQVDVLPHRKARSPLRREEATVLFLTLAEDARLFGMADFTRGAWLPMVILNRDHDDQMVRRDHNEALYSKPNAGRSRHLFALHERPAEPPVVAVEEEQPRHVAGTFIDRGGLDFRGHLASDRRVRPSPVAVRERNLLPWSRTGRTACHPSIRARQWPRGRCRSAGRHSSAPDPARARPAR
jgi:hypothetical protein